MIYFKIKKEADQRQRKDGSIFVGNELYTKGEVKKFAIPAAYYYPVEISSRKTYWFFGARFAENDSYYSEEKENR